jgi:hypothetical protein
MFRTILSRELQEIFVSPVLLSAPVVLTVLTSLSAYVQSRYYLRIVEDYAIALSAMMCEDRDPRRPLAFQSQLLFNPSDFLSTS